MSGRVILTWAARMAVTAALLVWVFSRDELRAGLESAEFRAPWWLGGAVLCGGLAALLGAWRWHICLRSCGCELPFTTALRISLAASAAGLLSIGPLGVDAVRLALATRTLRDKKAALLGSVALDHVSAVPAVAVFAIAAAFAVGVSLRGLDSAARTGGIALAAFAASGLALRFFARELHDRLLSGVRRTFLTRAAANAAFVSVPLLLVYYGVFWCAAQALRIEAPAAGLFGAIAAADALASLPVSIAGLGVREKALEVLLFKWFAVAPAFAVKTSLTGFAILALWAVAGTLAAPFRAPRERA